MRVMLRGCGRQRIPITVVHVYAIVIADPNKTCNFFDATEVTSKISISNLGEHPCVGKHFAL